MFENLKFKGIFYKSHTPDQRVYLSSEDIDHLEYVDIDTEDGHVMVYFKDQTQQR